MGGQNGSSVPELAEFAEIQELGGLKPKNSGNGPNNDLLGNRRSPYTIEEGKGISIRGTLSTKLRTLIMTPSV